MAVVSRIELMERARRALSPDARKVYDSLMGATTDDARRQLGLTGNAMMDPHVRAMLRELKTGVAAA